MKLPGASIAALSLLVLGTACAQTDVGETGLGQAEVEPTEAEQAEVPASVAPEIPGVVGGGTRVELIGDGFEGTEGPISLPDGSLIFTETDVSRITRIAADDEISTFMEDTNGSNALGFDPEGRLISVQTTPGQTRVGVIQPSAEAEVFADNFEGRPFGRPNDMVVSIYAAIPPGVQIFSPEGEHLGTIPVPLRVQNLAFAGPDKQTLYLVGSGSAYKVQMLSEGFGGRAK